jgi:hypothetical protein
MAATSTLRACSTVAIERAEIGVDHDTPTVDQGDCRRPPRECSVGR